MKKTYKYKSAPESISEAITVSEIINDFLPPPEKLVSREETMKVTIALNKSSVNFFKKKSQETGVPYQTMIKSLIDRYAKHYDH